MVRRIFWLSVGLGAGATAVVMASRWLDRQKRKLSPASLGHQAVGAVSGLAGTLADAARQYLEAAAEKEAEIRAQLDDQG